MNKPINIAINPIKINPLTISRILAVIAFFLTLISVTGQIIKYFLGHNHAYGLIEFFYLDAEHNLPTLFSVLLLLCATLLLIIITLLQKRKRYNTTRWAILAWIFLFLTCDEWLSLHERLIEPVSNLFAKAFQGSLGIFYFAWVIPGIGFVAFLGLFFLKFLYRLPSRTRFLFLFAATVYIGGAIGIELFGGYYTELYGQENFIYSLIASIEEILEMDGIIIFIYALMQYIACNYKTVKFEFENGLENFAN